MSHDGGHRYDAFVVRLWRDAGSDHVLRAEVEHVPSGVLVRAAGVATGWVLDQIETRLAGPRIVVAPTSDGVAGLERAGVGPPGGD